jgi:hypothetical protein
MKKISTLFLVLALFSAQLLAQSTLDRGPYLNLGTPNSMVVKWRTTTSETGEVKYGTDQNDLSLTATESSAVTDHEILVSGLQPNTKYYYSVGTSSNSHTANDGTYFFKTSPTHGTVQPIRLWVIGDFGNGSQATIDVKNGFLNHYRDVDTDAWLWTGDNAYGDGTQEEYQEKVFEVYPDVFRNTVVWPSPGNHDYGSVDINNNGPYFDIFTLPENAEAGGTASNEEGYYSFDYGNVHFLSLNSEMLLSIVTNNTVFMQWLEQDLQNTTQPWVIAYWHQPPYTKGSHDSDDSFSRSEMMRNNVNPILEEYGCDLVLTGHSHGYERSYLINGHYGKSNTFNASAHIVNGTNGNANEGNAYIKYTLGDSANKGTVYTVIGCSGQKGGGDDPLNHPAKYMSTEDYHGSMVIDVNGDSLNAKFIDTTGAVLDRFTILKVASTGVKELIYENGIALNAFPNPFKDYFTIELTLAKDEQVTIEVKDVEGKLVERFGGRKFAAGKHQFTCTPKQQVNQGIYIVEMKTSEKQGAKRLVRME